MSGGFSNPIVNPEGMLAIPQVMSPNFNIANPAASPAQSWALLKNGLAYMFGLAISGGTITGPDYIINTAGAFFYNGTPAAGNLVEWIASASGTDAFGNNYGAGINSANAGGQSAVMNSGVIGLFSGINQIIEMTSDGLFFYHPAGGTGNLVASIAATAGTDPYGNPVIAGSASYTPGVEAVSMVAGQLFFYSWTGAAWASYASFGPGVGTDVLALNTAAFQSMAGTAANPTLIATDAWHTVAAGSFSAGFAAGSPAPQYALMPFGVGTAPSVAARGQVLLTGATAANAPMFTVPYTFARTSDHVTPNNLAGAVLGQRVVRIAATGAVQCVPTGANGNFVILDGIVANTG